MLSILTLFGFEGTLIARLCVKADSVVYNNNVVYVYADRSGMCEG